MATCWYGVVLRGWCITPCVRSRRVTIRSPAAFATTSLSGTHAERQLVAARVQNLVEPVALEAVVLARVCVLPQQRRRIQHRSDAGGGIQRQRDAGRAVCVETFAVGRA